MTLLHSPTSAASATAVVTASPPSSTASWMSMTWCPDLINGINYTLHVTCHSSPPLRALLEYWSHRVARELVSSPACLDSFKFKLARSFQSCISFFFCLKMRQKATQGVCSAGWWTFASWGWVRKKRKKRKENCTLLFLPLIFTSRVIYNSARNRVEPELFSFSSLDSLRASWMSLQLSFPRFAWRSHFFSQIKFVLQCLKKHICDLHSSKLSLVAVSISQKKKKSLFTSALFSACQFNVTSCTWPRPGYTLRSRGGCLWLR